MRRRIGHWLYGTLVVSLVIQAGCNNRKGFIIGADIKLEFNRIPWRTGADSRYETDDCEPCDAQAVCEKPAGPQGSAEGCARAPLPGDCGLPPVHPHPRSRFHPLPMHDVLRGPQPAWSPPAGGVIMNEHEETLLPIAPPTPPKAMDKPAPTKPAQEKVTGNAARRGGTPRTTTARRPAPQPTIAKDRFAVDSPAKVTPTPAAVETKPGFQLEALEETPSPEPTPLEDSARGEETAREEPTPADEEPVLQPIRLADPSVAARPPGAQPVQPGTRSVVRTATRPWTFVQPTRNRWGR